MDTDGNNLTFVLKDLSIKIFKWFCLTKKLVRCATTTYMSGIYYDWKVCNAAEAGIDVGGQGTGTTVTGQECVPMVYGGVSYEGCTSDTYR